MWFINQAQPEAAAVMNCTGMTVCQGCAISLGMPHVSEYRGGAEEEGNLCKLPSSLSVAEKIPNPDAGMLPVAQGKCSLSDIVFPDG